MAVQVPAGFLWGASTAAHQVEGQNATSDWWAMEHSGQPMFEEKSGDACDSYHRYREDIELLASAGLTAYRFSIEWARIEPEPGEISRAQLAHYRRMIEACLAAGIEPVVTLHHFTNPRWLTADGGWLGPSAVPAFARYVEAVAPILDGVTWVATFNEPNMGAMMAAMADPQVAAEMAAAMADEAARAAAANDPQAMTDTQAAADTQAATDTQAAATDIQAIALPAPHPAATAAFTEAHHAAVATLRERGHRTGWTVATQDFQPEPGCEQAAADYNEPRVTQFLRSARGDDFVGVQAYTRTRVGPAGPLPVPDGAETTLTGWEFYPPALGHGIAEAWREAGVPILVTENGIATADDARRIAYLDGALAGMGEQLAAGVDVRGYLHWSALDNYEWGRYGPTFGLIAVDRETFERRPKPSLAHLGAIARSGALPS